MRAGWVNSGHASKFSQAGRFGGARKHIFVSGQAQSVRPKSERFASRGVGAFDVIKELEGCPGHLDIHSMPV
jgi:hypothetical protein